MYFLTNLIHTITTPIRWLFHWIMRCVPGLKNLPGVSLPMRLALTTFLFLLIVYIAAAVSYAFSDSGDRPIWQWLALVPLMIAIPVVVYYLVKFWMIKEESRYPEIDRLWQAGLEECERQGIQLTNVPLFLVLGARDQQQARQLMEATQISFTVNLTQQDGAEIAFFGNSESVFLFVSGCSCLSGLASAPSRPGAAPTPAVAPGAQPGGTIDLSAFQQATGGEPSAASQAAPSQVGQTLTEEAAMAAASSAPAPSPAPAPADVGGTILLPEDGNLNDFLSRGGGAAVTTSSSPQLSSQDIFEREQKLRFLCGLISKARQNLCPVNGLISLLPFELIENSSSQLQTAAQKDLAVLREELLVRCSNTVLVTQLDQEDGFQELIKRVGDERTREFRFGKGCELWNAPEGDRLDAIAAHAVGAFEDWIYMLFQEENALKHKYNSRLFMLLCRIRGRFANNLRAVLTRGFGFDPVTESHLAYEQFLFGGCYFAATGGEPSRQAFVKSVFLKGIQHEGELEWAPEARRRDSQLQFVANLFALLGAVSLLAIVGMLIYKSELLPG